MTKKFLYLAIGLALVAGCKNRVKNAQPPQEEVTEEEVMTVESVDTVAAITAAQTLPEEPVTQSNTLNATRKIAVGQRNIARMVILFDDNTYQELE